MRAPILYSAWYRNFASFSSESIRNFISKLKDTHFDGIELSIDYPLYFKVSAQELVTHYLKHEGLYLSIHLPWRDLELASPVEEIRKASLNVVLKCINELSKLEPRYFILHLTTEQDFCGYMNKDCIKSAKESLSEIIKQCEDVSIPLLIETTHDKCCSNEDTLPYILADFKDEPYIGVCLDPIHLLSRRIKMWGSGEDIVELVKSLPPIIIDRVEALHVHNYRRLSYGLTYVHLIPDDDILKDFMEIIRYLGNRVKIITIEVYKDLSGKDIDINQLRHVVMTLKEGVAGHT